MPILDFHTHAFPDALAERAISKLEEMARMKAETDGTVGGLLRLMDAHGVDAAGIASIATKPEQAGPILEWSLRIRSERIIPFASFHPRSPTVADDVAAIAEAGIKGVKLHPLYQEFEADDPAVFPAYELLREAGLIVLFHAGYDIGYPDIDPAAPVRFARALDSVPGMRAVLAHLGGWRLWEQAAEHVAGRDVYLDTSFAVDYCDDTLRDRILERHGLERILFASDSPWGRGGMARQLAYLDTFPASDRAKERILYENGRELLGL